MPSRSCAASRTPSPASSEDIGLSEPPRSPTPTPGHGAQAGSIGTPLEGVEMMVVDEGDDECPRRGRRDRDPRPQRDEGVLSDPRRPRRRCARLVSLRRHGPRRRGGLLLHRRPQEGLIIRGGYNVFPREVERSLRAPEIREAAVLGIPTTSSGGVAPPSSSTRRGLDPDEVSAYSRSGSRPTSTAPVWFLDDLPKGPTGRS